MTTGKDNFRAINIHLSGVSNTLFYSGFVHAKGFFKFLSL